MLCFANILHPRTKHNMELHFELRQRDPDAISYLRKYSRKLIRFGHIKNQIKFLRRCLEEFVIPKSFGRIRDVSYSGDAFPSYQRDYLEDRLLQAKSEREEIHLEIREIRRELQERLQSVELEGAMHRAG